MCAFAFVRPFLRSASECGVAATDELVYAGEREREEGEERGKGRERRETELKRSSLDIDG